MATIFKISRRHQIVWPQRCVVCGARDVQTVSSFKRRIVDFFSIGAYTRWSTETQGFSYPVCTRHRRLVSALHFFSPGSPMWYLLAGLGLYVVLMWNAEKIKTAVAMPAALATGGLFLGILLIRRFLPVFLNRFDSLSITLRIRNPSYAQEFEEANREGIDEKNGWSYQ